MSEQQTGLVARVTTLADQAIADEAVQAGMEHAKYALSVVVADAASLEQASQITLNLGKAKKALAAKKKPISSVLRDATARLADVFRPMEQAIADAEAYIDNQIKGYQAAQRRIAAEAEQKRIAAEAEQRRLERERAEAAAKAGTPPPAPAPPPVFSYTPPPQTKVRTEAGTVSERWDLKCELVNAADCNPEWLSLDRMQALAFGRAHAAEEGLKKEDGSSVVIRGVRFWYEAGVHKG